MKTLFGIAALGIITLVPGLAWGGDRARHALTIDDVLDTVTIERATTSPDGQWVAAVVQRPARPGEVFGRTAYEVDPSRSDVWLISTGTGRRRNLTHGQALAAGFWCATWSPDGRRLAMLSTRPEGNEPRGGDNVHLYVWDKDSNALTRAIDAPVRTQSRYGASIDALDLRGGANDGPAPHTCRTGEENAPFAWLDDNRLLVVTLPPGRISALLDEYGRPFDEAMATRQALRTGTVPTVSAMGSGAERVAPDQDGPRAIIRIVDVARSAATILADVPTYPFRGALTLSVSPDRRRIAILTPVGTIPPTPAFRLARLDGGWIAERRFGFIDLSRPGEPHWVSLPAAARYPTALLAWAPDSRAIGLRARARAEDDTAAAFAADIDGTVTRKEEPATAPENTPPEPPLELPPGAEILDIRPDAILWRDPTRTGLYLRRTTRPDGRSEDLLTVNTHLAHVDWGQTRLFDYTGAGGERRNGAILLPPGYREGERYPVITWVYPGYVVRDADDFWFDPYMPGLYNLRLYAARGYAILVPSLPAHRLPVGNDAQRNLAGEVLPAVDRLIELGIADPQRIGVMGHSFGGHSVYTLVTQTNRFRAAVALSGLTDLAQAHDQFDPTARGYPGIEHEKSANPMILEAGRGLGAPPFEDSNRYWRNSPIANVERVETPLLLIHGTLDVRGAPAQAETFFNALYQQGKTARLLRYWGESHSLAQSPANIRDIVRETLDWFDRYLR